MNEENPVIRNPREYIHCPEKQDITIETFPMLEKKSKHFLHPLIMQCIVSIINFSIISFIVSKDINVVLLCALITSVGSLITLVLTNQFENRKYNAYILRFKKKYLHYLYVKKKQIDDERLSFDKFYNSNYPDIQTCINRIKDGIIWDRFVIEPDFLLVRLGGYEYREFEVLYNPKEFIDDQLNVNKQIEKTLNKGFTTNKPVLVDLKNQEIGFWGTQDNLYKLFINIIIDVTFHHCYSDVKFIIIAPDNKFKWLSQSKFFMDESEGQCLFASGESEIRKIINYMYKVKAKRENSILSKGDSSCPMPYYLVCVLDERLLGMFDLTAFKSNKNVSITVLYFYNDFECLPERIIKVKCCEDEAKLFNDMMNKSFKFDNVNENDVCEYFKILNKFTCITKNSYNLPKKVCFFEGYGIKKPEELNILDRWRSEKKRRDLSIPVGIDERGENFEINLHETDAGAHCLIAGGTGSGKSEFIITLILSYAIKFSPEEVAFIIFDGKGGGLATYLKELPHIKESYYELNENVYNTVGVELKEELKTRQKTLSESSASHIDYYNSFSKHKMPHLMIILDEFAEIKRNFPILLKEIISASRIGRSLGIHLILATQHPSGVVDDDIWSNCKSKICFRTYNESDSQEILGDPIAYSFINPGQAVIEGTGVMRLFQTFYSGENRGEDFSTQAKQLINYIAEQNEIFQSEE